MDIAVGRWSDSETLRRNACQNSTGTQGICGCYDWRDDGSLLVRGKGRKERIAPMSPTTAKAVWDYVQRERGNSHSPVVFLSWQGDPITESAIQQMLRRRSREAGIRHVNPHLLRHTMTRDWCRAGGPLHALQTLLGHSSPIMTLRYGTMFSNDTTELHRQYSPVERLKVRTRNRK